jgi:hypothetical protein
VAVALAVEMAVALAGEMSVSLAVEMAVAVAAEMTTTSTTCGTVKTTTMMMTAFSNFWKINISSCFQHYMNLKTVILGELNFSTT